MSRGGTGKRWLWPGRLGFQGLCSWARRLAVLLRCPCCVLTRSFCSGEAVLPPAALPRQQSLPASPWERPGRAALRGRGGHFVPTDSPEPGGAVGRSCGAAVAVFGGSGRRHCLGFLDEALRRLPAPSRTLLFPTLPGSPARERPGEELAVVRGTDPLGPPAARA